ncbi:hypothetical protein T484DRAFT_3300301 [Baffinella frigidus]|nr:hypothetical protein T484DRAFT_3300301 [Cryptophyta sp. CCMP2293]
MGISDGERRWGHLTVTFIEHPAAPALTITHRIPDSMVSGSPRARDPELPEG